MPAGKDGDASSSNVTQRTTFRPPWVKEGPNPLPTPTAPWTANKLGNRRDSNLSEGGSDYNPLAGVQLRKTNIQTKEPQENGAKESFFQKPALKPVPIREKTPPKKDHKIHNLPTLQKVSERVLKSPPRKSSVARDDTLTGEEESSEEEESDEYDEDDVEIDKEVPTKRNAIVREASMRRLSQSNIPPPPPPQPGMPPPPPMMPGGQPKKTLTSKQKSRIDKLKSRPKNRPDWSNLLQEIESKKQLKHVVCNDRSQPLLPEAKAPDEHFLYKSEEPNVHNVLLKQIEGGIKLKKVKTNDRSKPILDGLRKFRRQMTIEEQIQKSISMASIAPEEVADEIDEMDDIDKVRDDLQSTKQMLALEMRNKEAQERENKRLLSRIQNLEAELEKERSKTKEGGSSSTNNDADEKVTQSLRKEADEARKTSQELEKKYTQAAEDLDSTKAQLEDLRRQNQMLEKKLQESSLGPRASIVSQSYWFDDESDDENDESISSNYSGKRMSISDGKHNAHGNGSDEDFDEEDPEPESDGEDTEEKREKRAQKELKLLVKKLQSFKTKEDNAKKERMALRDIIKKHQAAIKEEKKKFKQLKKEVNKMANLMKDTEEESEEEEEEEKEVEEEESEEEESTEEEESESETDESDSEKSQSEDEDAPIEKKKSNLSTRAKRHENVLNALKKGNFLLKTNAERLQDDLNKQKDMTQALQEDLDSVLSELG